MKIKLLSTELSNLIAAGEVVERPASVVKELLENSIDAMATEITVEIKNGGVSLIRVADNGEGMARGDAELCLLRHATSKIKVASDLDGIGTLGFRGEALAAISAVGRMRILTKRKRDGVGTLVSFDPSGRENSGTNVGDTGCRDGTTVIVEELFANVPARRKFLRKNTTEAAAVYDIVDKLALSHPEIAVTLISDGVTRYQTAGDAKLKNAIYAVLGREFSRKLVEVQNLTGNIEVMGYIGRPDNVKSNRSGQIFFINGRFIKSRTASAALEQAFSSYLSVDRFPTCVLNVCIHPAFVDVNVHPTKVEVKFSNERDVFDAIYCAVSNALSGNTAVPSLILQKGDVSDKVVDAYNVLLPAHEQVDTPMPPVQLKITTQPHEDSAFLFQDEFSESILAKVMERADSDTSPPSLDLPAVEVEEEQLQLVTPTPPTTAKPVGATLAVDRPDTPNTPATQTEEASETAEPPPEAFKIHGVAFDTYIIIEQGQKLMMIDKHAAHERIIFEEMKQNMQRSAGRHTQLLGLPIQLALSQQECALLEEYAEEVRACGFTVETENGEGLLLEIPGGLEIPAAEELFRELLSRLTEGSGGDIVRNEAFEKALYHTACRAAMKAGRRDKREDMEYIVRKLLSVPNIRYCPHGRPVIMELTRGRLDSNFKRI